MFPWKFSWILPGYMEKKSGSSGHLHFPRESSPWVAGRKQALAAPWGESWQCAVAASRGQRRPQGWQWTVGAHCGLPVCAQEGAD